MCDNVARQRAVTGNPKEMSREERLTLTATVLCLAKQADPSRRSPTPRQAPFGTMLRTGDFGFRGTSSSALTARSPRSPATCRSAEQMGESTTQD